MNSTIPMKPVAPTVTPAPYIGGKRVLSKRICTIIDGIPHTIYAEPFVGMGGVFLKRTKAPKAEVINDRSDDVANLFRIMQRHYTPFMDLLGCQITCRSEFNRQLACDPACLTDLERAARFLYLQRLAFGGKVNGRSFGIDPSRGGRFNMKALPLLLEKVHRRLAGVVIENLDWKIFVERYDRPETLFYLDPPYFGNEKDYGGGMFNRDQFAQMASVLTAIKGHFIMSINDRPEIRDLFRRFEIEPVELRYTVGGGGKSKLASELIIMG